MASKLVITKIVTDVTSKGVPKKVITFEDRTDGMLSLLKGNRTIYGANNNDPKNPIPAHPWWNLVKEGVAVSGVIEEDVPTAPYEVTRFNGDKEIRTTRNLPIFAGENRDRLLEKQLEQYTEVVAVGAGEEEEQTA